MELASYNVDKTVDDIITVAEHSVRKRATTQTAPVDMEILTF
jgi:hypothetical protein